MGLQWRLCAEALSAVKLSVIALQYDIQVNCMLCHPIPTIQEDKS